MNTTKHCGGCSDNFYNGNNSLGVARCWHLAKARLVTRYRIPINCPCNIRDAYVPVKVPSCYHERGYAFFECIPSYAQTREQRNREAMIEALQTTPSGEVGPFAVPSLATSRQQAIRIAYA